jgi:hypothetical protein
MNEGGYLIPPEWEGPIARETLKRMGVDDLDRFTDEQCAEILRELMLLDPPVEVEDD